ncbi:MAG TPA: alpha/beta hydrolase [Acidimicrobiales bacterium]|nr:alpha/beta hydrolase [Acidimicrobiales bacterium]
MSSTSTPHGLHVLATSPVPGLAVAERRVDRPEATIICIHGGLDRGGSFARLARRTDRFDLVTYDRRGYQGSRSLAPLGLQNHIGDLLALAHHEETGRPIILFGHSYGGVVALGTAIADSTISKLVITYEAPLPWILRRNGTRNPLSNDPALEAEKFFRRVVSDVAWERLSEKERDVRRLDGPALLDDLTSLHGPTPPFDIAQLRTPAVYTYGDVVNPDFYQSLSVKLASLNPIITSGQVFNAAHGAHLAVPDQLAALISELWDDTCASV